MLLQKRDYIGAVEQCISAVKQLNWADSTVMNYFMGAMYGDNSYNNKCIELPDGNIVKPVQAIEWLESQEDNSVSEPEDTEINEIQEESDNG